MTEKEKQAKLQYLLNSLSMTKEQKDIVVDLVNNSGGGGGDKDVITLELFENYEDLIVEVNVLLNNVKEFTETAPFGNQYDKSFVDSEKLANYLIDAHNKNSIIILKRVRVDDNDEIIKIINGGSCMIELDLVSITYYYDIQGSTESLCIAKPYEE